LAEAAKEGAEILGATVKDFGLLTTPQLHFVIAARNAGGALGNPTEEGYMYRMAGSFATLWEQVDLCVGLYLSLFIYFAVSSIVNVK
jgi:hypothetical protein